jgi:class I fructose-bisphosphate aldolase
MTGKQIRLGRIVGRDRRTVIVPVDQSITSGPIAGLDGIGRTIRKVLEGQPDAMIMHRGPVAAGLWHPGTAGLIVHLSAATQLSGDAQVKTVVCSVEEAVHLGADAVSVHISLGMGNERDNRALTDFGKVSDACARWGMPLLAMMYVYGKPLEDQAEAIIHAARIGGELGADLIKVNYTGDPASFRRLIDTSYAPVVIAGGSADGDGRDLLTQIELAMSLGAAGVCIGRNVFQHPDPSKMVRAISAVVHHGYSASAAYGEFVLSPGLGLEDGLDEDEPVLVRGIHASARSRRL